jgi:hypothetical protein
MASMSEQSVSQHLRSALAPLSEGDAIDDCSLRKQLGWFEFFLPQVLREVHGAWANESLDGFLPAIVRKTAPLEAEIVGHCILISDQTVAPFHLRVQIAADVDEICWMELRLGITENGKMRRLPSAGNWPSKHFWLSSPEIANSIDWAYAVTFGAKRCDSATL